MRAQPVSYNPKVLFFIVAGLPVIVSIMSMSIYFGLGHHHLNRIPALPECVNVMPESRVFSVGINIVAWLMLVVFLVIDRHLKLRGRSDESFHGNWCCVTRTVMNIFAGISFISLIGFSAVTANENKTVNIVFAGLFWTSLSVYFCLRDAQYRDVKLALHPLDWTCNAVAVACMIVSYALRLAKDERTFVRSIGAVFGYIGCTALFAKFIVIAIMLPDISLMLIRRKQ